MVSDKCKLVYIHIGKTAGSSMREQLPKSIEVVHMKKPTFKNNRYYVIWISTHYTLFPESKSFTSTSMTSSFLLLPSRAAVVPRAPATIAPSRAKTAEAKRDILKCGSKRCRD